MSSKKCSRCKRRKSPTEFRHRNATKDGLTAACTACLKKAFKVYYGAHRKQVIAAVLSRRKMNFASLTPKQKAVWRKQ